SGRLDALVCPGVRGRLTAAVFQLARGGPDVDRPGSRDWLQSRHDPGVAGLWLRVQAGREWPGPLRGPAGHDREPPVRDLRLERANGSGESGPDAAALSDHQAGGSIEIDAETPRRLAVHRGERSGRLPDASPLIAARRLGV